MTNAIYVFDPDHCQRTHRFVAQRNASRRLKTQSDIRRAVDTRKAALFITAHAGPFLRALSASPSSLKKHRLLLLDTVDVSSREVLRGIFSTVITTADAWAFLPDEELAEAVMDANAPDLIIGGIVDKQAGLIRFIRGHLESLVVPLAMFTGSEGSPTPNFEEIKLSDFGHTVCFGTYEAATDAILYETDREYRRRIKAKHLAEDSSLGSAIRRLRLQKGVSRDEFPDLSSKELARIERGEVKTPQRKTLKHIADRLGVRADELTDY